MNKLKGKFEESIVASLEKRCAKGFDFKWFYEPISLDYYETKKYTPDFLIETPNKAILVEAKGWFRPEDRRKMLTIKKQYPDIDIRLLFQSASNRLNKDSKTTYANWAEKHGFLWAEKEIPDNWLKD